MGLDAYMYKTTKKNYDAMQKLRNDKNEVTKKDESLCDLMDNKYHLTNIRKAYETLEWGSEEYKKGEEHYKKVCDDAMKDPEFQDQINYIQSKYKEFEKRKSKLGPTEELYDYDRDWARHTFINAVFNNNSENDNCVEIALPKEKIKEVLNVYETQFKDLIEKFNAVNTELRTSLNKFFNIKSEKEADYTFCDWRISFLRDILKEYSKGMDNKPNEEIIIYYYAWY